MSITIGAFDLFTHTIPGLLFYFVLYELFGLVGWKFVDLSKLTSFPQIAIALVLAYVIGHVLDFMSFQLLHLFQKRVPPREHAYNHVTKRCPELEIRFKPEHWAILWGILHQKNYESTGEIERFKADALMMRNISLDSLFLALIEIASLFRRGFSWPCLILLLGAISLTIIFFKISSRYDYWHYREIFSEALVYGVSLPDIIHKEAVNLNENVKAVELKPDKKGK